MGVLGGGWPMESGGGQARGGWINESVYLVSVGGWVCVCVGVLSVGLGPGLDSMSPARSRRSASHAAGTHGRLPQKTGRPGLPHLYRYVVLVFLLVFYSLKLYHYIHISIQNTTCPCLIYFR